MIDPALTRYRVENFVDFDNNGTKDDLIVTRYEGNKVTYSGELFTENGPQHIDER